MVATPGPGTPPGAGESMSLLQLVQQEAQRFGLPDWIAIPLVESESNFDPNATNSGHEGLLQISPDYPGAAGKNLFDPQTNLDIGFAQLGAAYKSKGSPAEGLNAFENVISSAGWDTWNGWASENPTEAANYIQRFTDFQAGQLALGAGSSSIVSGVGNAIGGALGGAGGAIGGALGKAGSDIGNSGIVKFSEDPFGWLLSQFGGNAVTLLIVLGALVIFLAAGFHVVGSGNAQTGAARVGSAGNALAAVAA